MSNGKNFSSKMKNFVEKAKKTPSIVIYESSKSLFALIKDRTPVLTGALVNNWNASAGNYQFVNRPPSLNGVDTMTSIANIPMGKTYWFVNNKPYVLRIEYEGWSHTKAPLGMVHISIAEFRSIIKAEVASIKSSSGALIWR